MSSDHNNLSGMTISPVQFGRAWERLDPKHRLGVNQNARGNDLAARIDSVAGFAKRAEVLAQILSPSGKVNVDKDLPEQLNCFPQSVCWKFPEKVD
jgi:hypothetical protein